jgi:ABC-type nitrate/sulfonate/bicarbonate transport system substrate-binding protein
VSRLILRWGNPPTGVLNAPVYLAHVNGGLTVAETAIVATDTADGDQHTRALLNDNYDMGHIGVPPLMAALSRTRDYALVGTGLLRYPPHSMLLPAGVKHLGEIRGRPIGINRLGTCSHNIVRTLLAREGMNESQVRIVELGGGLQNLDSIRRAELAAAVLWEPYTTTAIRELGWEIFAAGASMWSPSRYCTVIYARRSLVDQAPDLVVAVLRAYAGWVRATQLDQKAAAERVIREMPMVPADDIRSAVAREAPGWCPDTSLDRSLLERAIGELENQSVLADGFQLDDVIAPLSA